MNEPKPRRTHPYYGELAVTKEQHDRYVENVGRPMTDSGPKRTARESAHPDGVGVVSFRTSGVAPE